MKQSDLEREFETQYIQVGRHEMAQEYIFDEPETNRKKRMWRFDFAHIEAKVGVELDGGEHSKGRHVRPQGFIDDCEKMNAATMQGWAVLRFPGTVYRADPAGCIEMIDDLISKRLPNADAKEGADASTTEPEPVSTDVAAVVEAEPVEAPEPVAGPAPALKLLPANIPHPYKDAKSVFVTGHGQQVYKVKATGWLSGKPTVTVAIGKGIRTKSFDVETKEWKGKNDDILWTVFADRVSIDNPFIKKATEDIAA